MPRTCPQLVAPERAIGRVLALAFLAGAAILLAPAAAGQSASPLERTPGAPVTLTLENGDTLSGDLVTSDAATITLSHPILGQLTMDRSRVRSMRGAVGGSARPIVATAPAPTLAARPGEPNRVMPTARPEPDPPPAEGADAAEAEARDAPPKTPESAEPPPEAKPKWTGRLALGFNGSDGNADRLRLRYDAGATRTYKGETLNLNLAYSIATEGSHRSEHWLRANARNSWAYQDTPWQAFAEAETEFDEFKAYDVRLSAGGGAAYRIFDTDRTDVTARAGVGGRREFGGADNDITPEAIAGFELAHQLNARHRLTAQATYFPALDDLGDFRATGRAAWEILIDPELNLTLQFGAEDRYDSTPESRERNDLDYFAQLVLKF
jgi:putative salt-induced outer membrane protein YdiY